MMKTLRGAMVVLALLTVGASARAEQPLGLVTLSNVGGFLFDAPRLACLEPGRPVAVGLNMRRNFHEYSLRGLLGAGRTFRLQMNGNQISWSSARPEEGVQVVRANGRTYTLHGGYFSLAPRNAEALGAVYVTIPDAARGVVSLAVLDPVTGAEIDSFQWVRAAEDSSCESIPVFAYRAVPETPRAPFPMIGGTDFSNFLMGGVGIGF